MGPDYAITDIATLFAQIGHELSGAQRPQDVLDRLCAVSVERIDAAAWAGISQGRQGSFQTVAATADFIADIDKVQYALRSGPCVDAMLEDHVLTTPDLSTERRWPEFGRAAVERGVRSMMSYRLFLEDDTDTIAALNFYSPSVGAFDDVDETLAVLLATYGAAALARATESSRADNLAIALKSSREIGIAIGVLMSTYRITREEGFDILRLFSQRSHRKLADIAADVAETGALPELPARRVSPAPGGSASSTRSAG